MLATFCGSRCRSKCGPASFAINISGLIRFISFTQEFASSLSCVACTYRSETLVRAKAFLASQFNASHTRPLKTSGLTDRNTCRSSRIRDRGASRPTRKYSRIQRGALSLKSQGRNAAIASCDQSAIGLKTKPAQMTNPARFGGFEAANSNASGAEKDSANSTNGSALGTAALTNGRNSRYERILSAG